MLYGHAVSQVGDKDSPMAIHGAIGKLVNFFLKEYLDFELRFIGDAAIAHVGFVIFFLSSPMASKFFNFLRR